jgi:hypothetical protein
VLAHLRRVGENGALIKLELNGFMAGKAQK